MIVLIDNYDSFTYNLYQRVAQFHSDVHVIRNDHLSVQDIQKLPLSGIILSPGPGRPEKAGVCVELIQTLNSTIPVLGVCLGLQAIVVAFGSKVIPAPEIMHGKHDLIFHYRQGIYQHLPLPFQAGRYHSLITDRAHLSDDFLIEAENASGLVMGLRHKEYPVFGVQFHPESILTPMGHHLLENFVGVCHTYEGLSSC